MVFKYLDRAQQSVSGSPGTGNVTLGGALAGYQTFSQAGANNGDTFSYLIVDGTNWEFGVATYSSTGTNGSLVRTTVTKTSAQSTNPISVSSKASVAAVLRGEDLGSEATSLENLVDVNVNNATTTNGQVLTWNLSSGKWVASTFAAGSLSGLTDVNVTEGSAIDGYTLNWNNTAGKWEAVAPISPSGGSTSGAGTSNGSSTAQGNFLVSQTSGGGTALTVANNGTNVDTAATTLNFVNATSITTSSHDVTITLPTGGGGGGGNSPPSLTTFSYTANGTGASQSASYTSGKSLNFYRTDTGPGGDVCSFLGKAVPSSTPWKAALQFVPNTVGTQYFRCGIALYDSSTGKALLFGLNTQNNGPSLMNWYMSNLNTFASGLGISTAFQFSFPLPEWFRISFDGTTYTFDYSWDDVVYHNCNSLTAASYFTADHVGAFIEVYNSLLVGGMSILNYYEA